MFTSLAARAAGNQLLTRGLGRNCNALAAKRQLSSTSQSLAAQDKQDKVPTPADEASTLVKTNQQADKELTTGQELRTDRALFYPEQMEWLDERQVRISRPSKNVMQSGTAYTKTWKVEFNSQQRWENWLMGWTSTADPMSNLTLNFPTKEEAIEFCNKNKLQWFVEEQPERKTRRKSYADNFSWDKRTRLGSK